MKRLYGVAALLLALLVTQVRAQVTVIEEMRFNSNNSEDGVQKITFGFGEEYTDGADLDMGEQIYPPFFPPDGFFVFLTIPDDHGSEDFAVADIRGVPDSVKAGTTQDFALVYNMRLKRGIGQQVTISFPFKLRWGIDSINIVSPQAGANLNHTFTREGGQVTIHDLITSLRMTVYFNYDRAATVSDDRRGVASELTAIPNPVRAGEPMLLAGPVPSGGHVSVSDVYGATVWEQTFTEAMAFPRLSVPVLPAGVYMMRLTGAAGDVLGQGRFVVAR